MPWKRKWQLTPVFLPEKSWTEELGGLQSIRSLKSWTQLSDRTTPTRLESQNKTWRGKKPQACSSKIEMKQVKTEKETLQFSLRSPSPGASDWGEANSRRVSTELLFF